MIVLYAAIVLAVAGYVVPLSRKLVFWGFAVLLLVPLIVHGLLPYEPLRHIVGGSLRGWSAAAVVGALAFTYVSTVAGLKSRAHRQRAGCLPNHRRPILCRFLLSVSRSWNAMPVTSCFAKSVAPARSD